MWILITALLATADPAPCVCVCVDGLSKTQCVSAAAARSMPSACLPELLCPVLEPAPASDANSSPSPRLEQLMDLRCPEVRVWRRAWRSYDGVRVCDAA